MAEYKEGKLNGDFSQFYLNGNIEEYISFKDDQMDGEWVKYYENGILDEGIF